MPAPSAPPARAGESWAGELVVYTRPAAEVAFGDYDGGVWVPRPFHGSLPLTVREELAERLRVSDRRALGWAMKNDFALARDSHEWFTARLAAPADLFARRMRAAVAAVRGDSYAAPFLGRGVAQPGRPGPGRV